VDFVEINQDYYFHKFSSLNFIFAFNLDYSMTIMILINPLNYKKIITIIVPNNSIFIVETQSI